MENTVQRAFASQRSVPNQRLAAIVARVEKKYGVSPSELDDETLGLVSAAGEAFAPPSPKEDEDA